VPSQSKTGPKYFCRIYNPCMRDAGLAIAWVAGIVYASIPSFWLVIHPFAERWRSRKGSVYPIVGGIWLLLIFALGAATWPRRAETLYSSPWSLVVAAALFGLGIFTYRRIGRDFGGDRLIGRSEVRPEKYEQRLITTGMHARMRHPIYIAHLCMLTAWTVGSGLIVLYVLWAVAIVTGVFMIRTEDAELEKRFGDEYREYRKRVGAIGF
jgi:protein-S-isoprenylcysteine O-methyltransferase Ste14